MAQAQSNVSYLDNECIYCTDLMWNTIKWLNLTDSTLNLYNRLKEEVELFEGRPLCLTCEDIIKRKIKILKRIDPSYILCLKENANKASETGETNQ